MLASVTDHGIFHEVRQAAGLARDLVANGTPNDLELAEKVLDAILASQETSPDDPHRGNFYWMREDDTVTDLNAVEFVLEALIPMLLHHGERLPHPLRETLHERIKLGLAEIHRLDVLVAYTNIALLDIHNTCLGGELLQESAIAARGYAKLRDWLAFTNRSGHPFEFNSPTYTPIVLRVLTQLAELTQDHDTHVCTLVMAARIGLSAALHLHLSTRSWAGPHGRAYQPALRATTSELERFREWLQDGTLPAWLEPLLESPRAPFQITETAEADRKMGLTTYHSASFTLGTASQPFSSQSNVLIAYYQQQKNQRGVFYTRYLTNDRWFGDFYHATDRSYSRNLLDEGDFWGVQDGPRVLAAYAPKQLEQCSSAKVALVWNDVEEVWVGDTSVQEFPVPVPEDQTLIVVTQSTLFAFRALSRVRLGRNAPTLLTKRDGQLVLELYQHRGPEKAFWELRWPGAFYHGRPVNSFYLELAERSAYPSPQAFVDTIATGKFHAALDLPFTYAGHGERHLRLSYDRDGQSIGLDVELMQWQLSKRWTAQGELGWPMLDSPHARESATAEVSVGEARFSCDQGPVWLFADPAHDRYVAGYRGLKTTKAILSLPTGQVNVDTMGVGVIVWDRAKVSVTAVDLDGVR